MLYYLTSEQKESELKPLLNKKAKLQDELFWAKINKTEKSEIYTKLSKIDSEILILKKHLDCPIYKY
jgi:hypothetical protein